MMDSPSGFSTLVKMKSHTEGKFFKFILMSWKNNGSSPGFSFFILWKIFRKNGIIIVTGLPIRLPVLNKELSLSVIKPEQFNEMHWHFLGWSGIKLLKLMLVHLYSFYWKSCKKLFFLKSQLTNFTFAMHLCTSIRRDGRAVECGRLEICFPACRNGGSNPSLSAK